MVNLISKPVGGVFGQLKVPGDKSISHRAVMLGAIARGQTTVKDALRGDDVRRTIAAFRTLGIEIDDASPSRLKINGAGLNGLRAPKIDLDCGNSGTAMRLLSGLLAAQPHRIRLTGDASLSTRPMLRVVEPLRAMGAEIATSAAGTPPLEIKTSSRLTPINWQSPVASAQVKSAILLAGLHCHGETTVTEPALTRNHTEIMLATFGCPVRSTDTQVSIAGGCELQGQQIQVPADISSAAFFIAAAVLTPASDLTLTDVGVNPTRIGLLDALKRMGADIQLHNLRQFGGEPVADLRVRHSQNLSGTSIDGDLIPKMIDEIPVFAVIAAHARGATQITDCEELRVKESDRIAAIAAGLGALGTKVEELPDGLVIEGGSMQSGIVESFGDHRIAMAFAVAGAAASGEVLIQDCDCIETSFPEFAQTARQCGMQIVEAVDA